MTNRRIIGGLAAAALAVVLPVSMAGPAQAGAEPTVVSWTKLPSNACTVSSSTVRANPGSRITLHNNCVPTTLIYFDTPPTYRTIAFGLQATITISAPTALGTYRLVPANGAMKEVTLTVTDTPINEPMAHDDFQQVGVPASGDCADVDPTVGHYPGYPIGGWSKSWAKWIYNGTGGPVCTRELEQRPDGEIVLIG